MSYPFGGYTLQIYGTLWDFLGVLGNNFYVLLTIILRNSQNYDFYSGSKFSIGNVWRSRRRWSRFGRKPSATGLPIKELGS